MKTKKLFAILSAAMLGCCALGGTAFAEETEPLDLTQYQMGDINIDGEVDVEDAQIALQLYSDYLAGYSADESYQRAGITAEQAKLGDIVSESAATDCLNDLSDAFYILSYYADSLSKKSEGETVTAYIQRLMDTGLCKAKLIVNDWRYEE